MKVLYDYQVFSLQGYGGASRLFCELIRHVARTGVDVSVFAGMHINEYAGAVQPAVCGVKVRPIQGTKLIRTLLNHAAQEVFSMVRNPDIIHYTYYAPYLRQGRAKTVVTVLDMIHERFGGSASKTAVLKKRCCEAADAIIAISQSTKKDVVEILRIDPAKVIVIYPGATLPYSEATTERRSNAPPYILYVGGRGGYKNFDRFIQAFAGSPLMRKHLRVMCFGGGEFSPVERSALERLGIGGLIDRVDGDDEALRACYRNARAFIYPSLYEGFGFPPLEAMRSGCPVVCSRISSIPEVVGDAGRYFDPYRSDSIQDAMIDVVFNDTLIMDLSDRGRKRSESFGWDRCARETIEVYNAIL